MRKPPDLSLIGADAASASVEAGALAFVQQELEQYAAYDQEDEAAYERRVRQAFHARELKQIDEIIESRKNYANKIFCLVVWWLVGMGLMLLLSGFRPMGFDLDNKVLLALIGGTTLNVLGIFTIVANFLFPKNGHSILSRRPEDGEPKKSLAARKSTRTPKPQSQAASEEATR